MTAFIFFIALGLFAGLLAGLLGVGGGIIIVPSLIIIFTDLGFSSTYSTQMAVASSLATIFFTSLSAVRTHNQAKLVDWFVVGRLSLGILFGAVLAAYFAVKISGGLLQALFGIFAILISIQMFFAVKPEQRKPLPSKLGLSFWGSAIGFVSALFGIGGGSLNVPLLTWFNFDMKKAVATSAACGLSIALFGLAGYALMDILNPEPLPKYSFAYVYWPAVLAICVTSIVTAHFGALIAHRLPAQNLKRVFALFLFVIGISLVWSSGGDFI